jgi:hypothetical protein
MKLNKLTLDQQKILSSNPNVRKVSASTVQYTPEFKIKALSSIKASRSANSIFREAKIPIDWFGKEYARKRIQEWRKLAHQHGEEYFHQEQRGRSIKQHSEYQQMTETEKVKHLELKVEALEYVRCHFQLPPVIVWKPHNYQRRRNIK